MDIDYERLSRTLSHALRHAPRQYGLTLDDEGYAPMDELLDALREHREDWANLTAEDIHAMLGEADKQRYEVNEHGIRALYGHSRRINLKRTPQEPPEVLYHGTSYAAYRQVVRNGLKAIGRQYVHLSLDEVTAYEIALRHARRPVILEIEAQEAFDNGIGFYAAGPSVWLSDPIPPEYIYRLDPPEGEEDPAEGEGYDDLDQGHDGLNDRDEDAPLAATNDYTPGNAQSNEAQQA